MIIFDLDGCLADCEHRRHFVDPEKNQEYHWTCFDPLSGNNLIENWGWWNQEKPPNKFIPDWKAFYEACEAGDKDLPVEPVIEIFRQLNDDEYNNTEIQIWSGRCESVREKTEIWLKKYCSFGYMNCRKLKMRPIGENTPDAELKEKWLDEYLSLPTMDFGENGIMPKIDFVFDDSKKVRDMWRRRGIFVFDVNQGKEF